MALACLLLYVPAFGQGGHNGKSSADSDYIGSDACQSCHDDSYNTFKDSPHAVLLENKKPSQQGCEACHGPGAAHANSNGDTSRIFNFAQAKPVEVRSRCGSCHAAETEQAHLRQAVSCLVCHSPHHYTQKQFLLIKPPEKK